MTSPGKRPLPNKSHDRVAELKCYHAPAVSDILELFLFLVFCPRGLWCLIPIDRIWFQLTLNSKLASPSLRLFPHLARIAEDIDGPLESNSLQMA